MTQTLDLTLVADIGGTNTRVALASGPTLQPGSIRRYRNAEAGSLSEVFQSYLVETGARPVAACVLSPQRLKCSESKQVTPPLRQAASRRGRRTR